jgi:hypothetical protein
MTVLSPAVGLAIIGLFDCGRSKQTPRSTPRGVNAVAMTTEPSANISPQKSIDFFVIRLRRGFNPITGFRRGSSISRGNGDINLTFGCRFFDSAPYGSIL